MGLAVWVNADEIQGFIVVTRIHDNSPICPVPHSQNVVFLYQWSCEGILECNLLLEEKSKRGFSRTEETWLFAVGEPSHPRLDSLSGLLKQHGNF